MALLGRKTSAEALAPSLSDFLEVKKSALQETERQLASLSASICVMSRHLGSRVAAFAAGTDYEKNFKSLVNLMPDGLLVVDACGVVLTANPRLEEILGYTPPQMIGEQVGKFIHVPYLFLFEPSEDSQPTRHVTAREILGIRRDGTMVEVSASVSEIVDLDDGLHYFICVLRDITTRKRMERALAEQRDIYQQLFAKSPAPKIIFDARSRNIVDANPAAARFYGRTADELRGLTVDQLAAVPGDICREHMQRLDERETHVFRSRHVVADGGTREVVVYVSSIRTETMDQFFSIIVEPNDAIVAEYEK